MREFDLQRQRLSLQSMSCAECSHFSSPIAAAISFAIATISVVHLSVLTTIAIDLATAALAVATIAVASASAVTPTNTTLRLPLASAARAAYDPAASAAAHARTATRGALLHHAKLPRVMDRGTHLRAARHPLSPPRFRRQPAGDVASRPRGTVRRDGLHLHRRIARRADAPRLAGRRHRAVPLRHRRVARCGLARVASQPARDRGAVARARPARKRSQSLGVLLISGYAPVSTASEAEWIAYYSDVALALSHRHTGDVVVWGTDGNGSIGRGSIGQCDDERTSAVGPYGIAHINHSGRRLRTFLETNELAALSSFFRKPYYGTWLHPRSKRMHQLDQVIVSRSDVFRFTDAGSMRGQLIDSDHRPVGCKLRIAVGQHRKAATDRSKLLGLDYTSIRGPAGAGARRTLACSVLRHLGLPQPPPPPQPQLSPTSSIQQCGYTQIDPLRPSLTLQDLELLTISPREDARAMIRGLSLRLTTRWRLRHSSRPRHRHHHHRRRCCRHRRRRRHRAPLLPTPSLPRLWIQRRAKSYPAGRSIRRGGSQRQRQSCVC